MGMKTLESRAQAKRMETQDSKCVWVNSSFKSWRLQILGMFNHPSPLMIKFPASICWTSEECCRWAGRILTEVIPSPLGADSTTEWDRRIKDPLRNHLASLYTNWKGVYPSTLAIISWLSRSWTNTPLPRLPRLQKHQSLVRWEYPDPNSIFRWLVVARFASIVPYCSIFRWHCFVSSTTRTVSTLQLANVRQPRKSSIYRWFSRARKSCILGWISQAATFNSKQVGWSMIIWTIPNHSKKL